MVRLESRSLERSCTELILIKQLLDTRSASSFFPYFMQRRTADRAMYSQRQQPLETFLVEIKSTWMLLLLKIITMLTTPQGNKDENMRANKTEKQDKDDQHHAINTAR